MPMYEYRCAKCDATFEELVKSAKERVACPTCGGKRVSRLMSKVAFSSGGKFVSSVKGGGSGCSSCSSSSCSSCGGS